MTIFIVYQGAMVIASENNEESGHCQICLFRLKVGALLPTKPGAGCLTNNIELFFRRNNR